MVHSLSLPYVDYKTVILSDVWVPTEVSDCIILSLYLWFPSILGQLHPQALHFFHVGVGIQVKNIVVNINCCKKSLFTHSHNQVLTKCREDI